MSPHNVLSSKAAAELVRSWIKGRQPAAVVRLLEGEARVLSASLDRPDRIKDAQKKLRKQSGIILPADEVMQVRDKLLSALDCADVLGIIGGDSRYNDEYEELLSRIYALHEQRHAGMRTYPAVLTNGDISEVLYVQLGDIVNGRVVSAVTSRDIAEPLHRLGAKDVRVFQVPSQVVRRAVDDEYEAAMHGTPIWPNFIRDLETRIDIREEGELFLVGAGLFGKHLCITVRNGGGIALDMGSQLDRLALKPTRGTKWKKFLGHKGNLDRIG